MCVDGVADPYELTAEAAVFAHMVNHARASGHGKGLVVVAQARFNQSSRPVTGQFPDDAGTSVSLTALVATIPWLPDVTSGGDHGFFHLLRRHHLR